MRIYVEILLSRELATEIFDRAAIARSGQFESTFDDACAFHSGCLASRFLDGKRGAGGGQKKGAGRRRAPIRVASGKLPADQAGSGELGSRKCVIKPGQLVFAAIGRRRGPEQVCSIRSKIRPPLSRSFEARRVVHPLGCEAQGPEALPRCATAHRWGGGMPSVTSASLAPSPRGRRGCPSRRPGRHPPLE